MLFDLAVCKTSTVESVTHKNPLYFVARCYWQIESEFDQGNTREIVIDMSMLVMGSANNKLFVASHKRRARKGETWETDVLDMCKKIAKCCNGNLFFCFIAHPKDWGNEFVTPPSIHQWISGDWEPV